MQKMRFSLLALLASITYLAMSVVALANASGPFASFDIIANFGILLTATIGIILCRDTPAAFAIGFAVFGWSFLLVCHLPIHFKDTVNLLLRPAYELTLHEGNVIIPPGGSATGAVSYEGGIPIYGPKLHDFLFVAHVTLATLFGLVGGFIGNFIRSSQARN